jgi:hypothetical protein
MMIIATSITQPYLEKSQPFFDSVNKNFKGKKICFCIGFYTQIEGWETIEVKIDQLSIKWQPKNRENYYSLQHGEFVKFYDFKDNDIVYFVDSDMVLQRELPHKFHTYTSNEFYVSRSSFPPTLLRDVLMHIGSEKLTRGEFCRKYSIDIEEEFCAALLIGSIKMWKRLYWSIEKIADEFLENFSHHAAWQLLINVAITKLFQYDVMSPLMQNAEWYSGTEAVVEKDQLKYNGQVVYFNHTKFNRNFKY